MDAKEFQKVFRENSLMLYGHPNHFGIPSAPLRTGSSTAPSLLRRSGLLRACDFFDAFWDLHKNHRFFTGTQG